MFIVSPVFVGTVTVDGANDLMFTGSASGQPVTIQTAGADASIGLTLTLKGSGTFNIAALNATGGTINGVAIGAAAPSTGAFTTLSVTGGSANGMTLGATTPSTVTATTLAASDYTYRSGATALTAAGTTQATALVLNRTYSVLTTVAAGSGAILPNRPPVTVATIPTFAEFVVVNGGANALLLYPASGLSINALAANAAFSIAAGASVRIVQDSTTKYRSF